MSRYWWAQEWAACDMHGVRMAGPVRGVDKYRDKNRWAGAAVARGDSETGCAASTTVMTGQDPHGASCAMRVALPGTGRADQGMGREPAVGFVAEQTAVVRLLRSIA